MIENDDMLHRVDRHYLGPTGFTLPFRVRYGAVGIGFVIPVAIFIIARAIVHVPINFQSIVIILALGVVLTRRSRNTSTPIAHCARCSRPHGTT